MPFGQSLAYVLIVFATHHAKGTAAFIPWIRPRGTLMVDTSGLKTIR